MDNSQKFRFIIATILGLPEDGVTDTLTPDDVDTWDSLNHINIIGALEQEFGLQLTTDNMADSMSIVGLRALLAKYRVTV